MVPFSLSGCKYTAFFWFCKGLCEFCRKKLAWDRSMGL